MKRYITNLVQAIAFTILFLSHAQAQDAGSMLGKLRTIPMNMQTASVDVSPVASVPEAQDDENEKEFLRNEVRENVSSVYRCAELRRATSAGRIQVAVTVLPSGDLSNIRVKANFSHAEPNVVRCIHESLADARIGNAPDQEQGFRYTFNFAGATVASF